MENKSKGIAWVGNIYQKFEAICMEMDDMETFKYVENQLQTVGANVKQFCSELMLEVLPSSHTNSVEELNSSPVQNDGITACEESNISVDEDHSQKALVHSSSLESVEDVHFGLFLELNSVQNDGVTACEESNISVDEDHSQKELVHSSSLESVEDVHFGLFLELNSSLVQNDGVTACEESNISVDEDHSQKELVHSSSLESVEDVHFGLFLEQSKEDESSLAHCSGSIPSDSVILAQTGKNELRDIDSTLDHTSLESTEEASHKSVSKEELEAVPVPSFDKVKLEESCIIVNSSELQSLSNESGERRSYKKKFQEAFSSKFSRSAKRDNEQHAESSKEKGNGVGLSSETNKSESQDMEFCGSDWEII